MTSRCNARRGSDERVLCETVRHCHVVPQTPDTKVGPERQTGRLADVGMNCKQLDIARTASSGQLTAIIAWLDSKSSAAVGEGNTGQVRAVGPTAVLTMADRRLAAKVKFANAHLAAQAKLKGLVPWSCAPW